MDTARPAVAADLVEVVALWRRALKELDGQRGGAPLADSLDRDDLEGYLSSALDDPDRLIVIGSLDGNPVGLASVWADRSRRDPLGQLELVFVEPDARRSHVAEAMVQIVMERCAAWGMAGVDGPALPGNRPAKSFFESNGFTARLLVMHRRLP